MVSGKRDWVRKKKQQQTAELEGSEKRTDRRTKHNKHVGGREE